MVATRAFDLAQWVPPVPANVQDGLVVSALGPPFTSTFAPVVKGTAPGLTAAASLPAASGAGQTLVSAGSAGFPWTAAASSSSLPAPTAQNQILVSGPGPTYAWTTQLQYGASAALPLMNGTPSAGAAGSWSAGDHVHPVDTSRYAASNPSGYQTAAQVGGAIAASAYALPTASTTVLGGVKVDGTSIGISGGVISATGSAGIPDAPPDGTSYLRNNSAWTNNIDCGTF